MKWLCIIFAVGVLTSAVYAAPANSDMQQREDEPGVQGWGTLIGHAVDKYYQRKSEAAKAQANSDMQQGEDEPGVQGWGKTLGSLIDYYQRKGEAAKAQEINQVMKNNEAEAEGIFRRMAGHFIKNNYQGMEDAELQDSNDIAKSLQDDGKADLQGFKWKKLFKRARKLYKYGKKHGYFGAAAVQQDGDLMAELESLPEEAQAQIALSLLGYGSRHIFG